MIRIYATFLVGLRSVIIVAASIQALALVSGCGSNPAGTAQGDASDVTHTDQITLPSEIVMVMPAINTAPVFCSEQSDACVNCLSNTDCSDGLFCDGQEACVRGVCVQGTPPCFGGQTCDEASDQCESSGNTLPMATASRNSGPGPLGVFFDPTEAASGVVMPPTFLGRPQFHEFRYEWRFGDDPSATWVGNGASKNEHVGYLAAHVFEDPGTYTVTLRVTEPSGAVFDYEESITVVDPELVYGNAGDDTAEITIYVSPSGSDSNNGSRNSPMLSAEIAYELSFDQDGPRRLLFERGGVYPCDGALVQNFVGPFMIGSYGDPQDADPIITGTSVYPIFSMGMGSDLTITGLHFVSDYNPSTGFGLHPNVISMLGDNSDITIYKNRMSNAGLMMHLGQLGTWTDCIIADNLLTAWQNYGVLTGALDRVALIGNSIKQDQNAACCDLKSPEPPEPDFADHGPLRLREANKTLVTANDLFSNTGWGSTIASQQPCLRLGTAGFADLSIVSDNLMEGGAGMAGSGPSNSSLASQVGYVVFERNRLLANEVTRTFFATSMGGYVIRNNVFIQPDGGDFSFLRVIHIGASALNDPLNLNLVNYIYNNTYVSLESDSDTGFFLDVSDGGPFNIVMKNNIVYAPNAGPSNHSFIRWTQSNLDGLVCDDNLLYSNADHFIDLWGDEYSLGQWRSTYGQDQSTILADPLFVDIPGGDFHLQTLEEGYPQDSPAVNAGEDLPWVQLDYDGVVRPLGGGWDIGAFESGSLAAAPMCGNGVLEQGEACDQGAANSDSTPDACRSDCTAAGCGDGVVDSGEACDDGNTTDGDGCSAVCQPEASVERRFWVGGSGNWSQAAHWSVTSGGAGGASVPDVNLDAFFDGNSGAGIVTLDQSAQVRDLLLQNNNNLVLNLAGSTLSCARDCLFLAGGIDQGQNSTLICGRNLDTANCELNTNGHGFEMDVHLTGTGYWRYTLGVSGQPRPFQPHIRNLLAAQSGQTTVLRPVGPAIMGVDIDIANQLMLGDSTGLLTMDLSDADPGGVVTLEIHSDGLDIVSGGAQVAVTNIEHELGGAGPGSLQGNVQYSGLRVYDLTGRQTGATWTMTGPLDVGSAILSLEKTMALDTNGYDLQADRIFVGNGNATTAELFVRNATVTSVNEIRLSRGSQNEGLLHLDTGSVTATHLQSAQAGGSVDGQAGSSLTLTGSVSISGTVYYVSSSDPNATDGGAGSPAQPFSTFGRGVQALAPGVTVLFKRGDTWLVPDGTLVDINGGLMGAFDSGARPQFRLSGGAVLEFVDSINGEGALYDAQIVFE